MINLINIKNFKCFKNANIHLNNLTVLAGINSVGKSSLIQTLLIARQTYEKLIKNGISKDQTFKIHFGEDNCLPLGSSKEIVNIDASEGIIQFTLHNKDGKSIPLCYSAEKDIAKLYITYENKLNPNSYNESNLSIFNQQFHYLNTERIGPRVKQEVKDQDFPNTGYKGEQTFYTISNNIDFRVAEAKRIKNNEKVVQVLPKQIEYWMDTLFPGFEFNPSVYENINTVGMGFRRRTSGTDYLNPNNMGFGISYVLPIIVSGLLAEENSVLIIENPEVHLHPRAQSRIGYFLAQMASAGVQVIIETHSEHVINGIRIASLERVLETDKLSINYFDLDEQYRDIHIEHIQLDEYAELSKWPRGFLDQSHNDLRELIKLRREGRSL